MSITTRFNESVAPKLNEQPLTLPSVPWNSFLSYSSYNIFLLLLLCTTMCKDCGPPSWIYTCEQHSNWLLNLKLWKYRQKEKKYFLKQNIQRLKIPRSCPPRGSSNQKRVKLQRGKPFTINYLDGVDPLINDPPLDNFLKFFCTFGK